MFKNQKILAIIPARGGSKSIPKKNIIPVGGKPLIAWTIEAARKSKYIDKVVVSSDSNEILKVASKYKAEPIKRPARLATDTAKPEPLIFHVMDYLKKNENYVPEIIVYLQPTSPLRDTEDIDMSVEKVLSKKATAVIGVHKLEKKYLKTFIADKAGYLKGSVNNDYPFMNRQQLPDIYMPNGIIFTITRKEFMKTGRLFSNKTVPHITTAEKGVDLDTIQDLQKLKRILKKEVQNHE